MITNNIFQTLFNNTNLQIVNQKNGEYNLGTYVKLNNNKNFWIIPENNLNNKMCVLVQHCLENNNLNFVNKLNDLWILNSMVYEKFKQSFKEDIEDFVLENPLEYSKYLWNQRPLLDKDIYSYDQIEIMIDNYIDYCFKYPLEFLKNHYNTFDNNIDIFLLLKDCLKIEQIVNQYVEYYGYVDILTTYWNIDIIQQYDYIDNVDKQKYLILQY